MLAITESDSSLFSDIDHQGHYPYPDMRPVAKRLGLGIAAGAPEIGAGLHIAYIRLGVMDSGFAQGVVSRVYMYDEYSGYLLCNAL
jgi:hypothetical protein